MPEQASALIREQVTRMQQAAGGGIALGAAAVALWGASRGSVSLGRALNRVFDSEETRPWWKVQLIGVSMTLLVAALLITALGLLVVGPVVGSYLMNQFGLGGFFDVVWTIARWLGAALLVMLIWALLYRYLPDTEEPVRVFTPGAAVGVILWIGISLLFALWVSNFGDYDQTYGALGTVMVFLSWLWLSNIAMLAGAEINDVLRREGREARGEEEIA
jgi:membrane protein